jgi:hypothetical protein
MEGLALLALFGLPAVCLLNEEHVTLVPSEPLGDQTFSFLQLQS